MLGTENKFAPAVDVREAKDKYIFHVEVPGCHADDLQVTGLFVCGGGPRAGVVCCVYGVWAQVDLKHGALVISGKKAEEWKEEGSNHIHEERRWGTFSRSFAMPPDVTPQVFVRRAVLRGWEGVAARERASGGVWWGLGAAVVCTRPWSRGGGWVRGRGCATGHLRVLPKRRAGGVRGEEGQHGVAEAHRGDNAEPAAGVMAAGFGVRPARSRRVCAFHISAPPPRARPVSPLPQSPLSLGPVMRRVTWSARKQRGAPGDPLFTFTKRQARHTSPPRAPPSPTRARPPRHPRNKKRCSAVERGLARGRGGCEALGGTAGKGSAGARVRKHSR